MLLRVYDALLMAFHHRKALHAYRSDKTLQSPTLLDINPATWVSAGIKALALDFDGVLGPHGAQVVDEELVGWLKNTLALFGADRIFIVSNKPSLLRAAYFETHFPGIRFIFPKRKKPYPDSLLAILAETKLKASELLVVDDRLLTGVLAAITAGTKACYITNPTVDFKANTGAECFIGGLRLCERLLF